MDVNKKTRVGLGGPNGVSLRDACTRWRLVGKFVLHFLNHFIDRFESIVDRFCSIAYGLRRIVESLLGYLGHIVQRLFHCLLGLLELITDEYSRGAVSIVDLLDAQNASLVADQAASNAEYDFLFDLMGLQRAANSFGFFLSEDERELWFERLEVFYVAE